MLHEMPWILYPKPQTLGPLTPDVFNGTFESFTQINRRLPFQNLGGAIACRVDPIHLTRAQRLKDRVLGETQELSQYVEYLEYTCALA